MKVLQINSVCGYGSTGRIATDLYEVLINEGHECCIAYGRGNASKQYRTIKVGNFRDFLFHVMLTRLLDRHGFGSKKATKDLIKKIKEYQPDLIQIHNLHGYYINIEVLFDYLAKSDIPIVWLLHDAWAINGHGAHFELTNNGEIPQKNLGEKDYKEYPKSLFLDYSEKNYILKRDIFTKVSKQNMMIISPSKWLRNLVKKSYLSEYDIKVINNGIDLSLFRPLQQKKEDNNSTKDKKIVLGVSSIWNIKKGLDVFNKLAEDLPSDFIVKLVGTLPKNKSRLNPKIVHIERTENIHKLVEIYNEAYVFVNPTIEDNFPTTNIEALACGTPVFTYNTGGSPEAIDSKTGRVIEKENYNELLHLIKEMGPEDFNRDECVKRARKFDKRNIFRNYEEIYRELVENKKSIL